MFTVIKNFLFSIMFLVFTMPLVSENDPHVFIDDNAQLMITVLIENQALFLEDREEYEQKIKDIFEPMIDFKRVAASVMGKKYYLASTPDQRNEFVDVFKDSLLFSDCCSRSSFVGVLCTMVLERDDLLPLTASLSQTSKKYSTLSPAPMLASDRFQ